MIEFRKWIWASALKLVFRAQIASVISGFSIILILFKYDLDSTLWSFGSFWYIFNYLTELWPRYSFWLHDFSSILKKTLLVPQLPEVLPYLTVVWFLAFVCSTLTRVHYELALLCTLPSNCQIGSFLCILKQKMSAVLHPHLNVHKRRRPLPL